MGLEDLDSILRESVEGRRTENVPEDTSVSLDSVLSQSATDRGVSSGDLLDTPRRPPNLSVDGFIIPETATPEGKMILDMADKVVEQGKRFGDKPSIDMSSFIEDDPATKKGEMLFKLREAYFDGDIEEEFGIDPETFSVGMLSWAFVLDGTPEGRVEALKKLGGVKDAYNTQYDGRDFLTIVGKDGKVNEIPMNLTGEISKQDFIDVAFEGGVGALGGLATGGLGWWQQILTSGLMGAGGSASKDVAATLVTGTQDGISGARAGEAATVDTAIETGIQLLRGAGKVGGFAVGGIADFLKRHFEPLMKKSSLYKDVAEGAVDATKAEDLGIIASLGSDAVTRTAEEMVKAGKSIKEINADLGTNLTESMFAASKVGHARAILAEHGGLTDELGDKVLQSNRRVFVKTAEFVDEITNISTAQGAPLVKKAASDIIGRANKQRAEAGDKMGEILDANPHIKINFQKRIIEPLKRIKEKVVGNSKFDANLDAIIATVIPPANKAVIDRLRPVIAKQGKEIRRITKLLDTLEKGKLNINRLPGQKATRGGMTETTDKFKGLTDKLNELTTKQTLDKANLDEMFMIPPKNLQLIKNALEEMKSNKEISGRAFFAGLNRVNSVLTDIIPKIKGAKGEYAKNLNELINLEKTALGEVRDAHVMSARKYGDSIFSVDDAGVIRESLDLVHSVDPKAADLVVKDQLLKFLGIDETAVALTRKGENFRGASNVKELEFGVTPENFASNLNQLFEPGNSKGRAILDWIGKDPSKKALLDKLGQASGVIKSAEGLLHGTPEGVVKASVDNPPPASGNPIRDMTLLAGIMARAGKVDTQEAIAKGFHALLTSNAEQAVRIRNSIVRNDMLKEKSAANTATIMAWLTSLGRVAGKVKSAEIKQDLDRTRGGSGGGDFIRGLGL